MLLAEIPVGIGPVPVNPLSDDMAWVANQVSNSISVVSEERRRLGLGSAPVGDLVRLLESQGVRTSVVEMPDDISGLTIAHPDVGLFVGVNISHAAVRQRFY